MKNLNANPSLNKSHLGSEAFKSARNKFTYKQVSAHKFNVKISH